MRLLDPEQFAYHRARVAHYPRATNPVPCQRARSPMQRGSCIAQTSETGKTVGHVTRSRCMLRCVNCGERYISIE